MGGWLVVFIPTIAGLSLVNIGGYTIAVMTAADRDGLVGLFTGPVMAPAALSGIYGLFCTFLLCDEQPRAVKHTRRWILLWLVVNVVTGVVMSLLTDVPWSQLVASIVGPAIWMAYLTGSRRVALVYGVAAQQPPAAVTGIVAMSGDIG